MRTDESPTANRMVVLQSYADGVPGADHLSVVSGEIPVPRPGQALCRTLFVSLDPYLRLSMLPPDSPVPSGGRSLPLGTVVEGRGVAQVVESNIDDLTPGTLISGVTGWQDFSLVEPGGFRRVEGVTPPSAALGVLGMPGFTAWSGLKYIGRPVPGRTVVVSAASGAVGSLVVQLAQRWGCRAVGIAGSAEKCRWVKEELGADGCVSHRSASLAADVGQACPDGVDVYFDNVGGDVLAAVLPHMNRGGTIVVCGRIAHLNRGDTGPAEDRMPTLLGTILTKWLTVRGFAWSEFEGHWDEFIAEVGPLVENGKIRFREDIVDGLEQIPAAYGRLFDGRNFGKLVARL